MTAKNDNQCCMVNDGGQRSVEGGTLEAVHTMTVTGEQHLPEAVSVNAICVGYTFLAQTVLGHPSLCLWT
jgi:hypothetical protein